MPHWLLTPPIRSTVAGDAALTAKDGTVNPFRLDLSGSGAAVKGTLYDGFHAYDGTTSATYADGKLTLTIEHYLTTINAQLKDGQLVGDVSSQGRGQSQQFGFQAVRHVNGTEAAAASAPNIAGSWVVPLPTASAKGEKALPLPSLSSTVRKLPAPSCASMAIPVPSPALQGRQMGTVPLRRQPAGSHHGDSADGRHH